MIEVQKNVAVARGFLTLAVFGPGHGVGVAWLKIAVGLGREVQMRSSGRGLVLLSATFALALSASGAQEMAAKGIFEGHGVVRAIAPETGALTLAHDDIKGFMPAMEMMYRVRTPELSKDLRPGDVIDFKIDAEKYVIVDVKLIAHAK
jgi:Cu/Ag efflux protein CusF